MKHRLPIFKMMLFASLLVTFPRDGRGMGLGLSAGFGYEKWQNDINYSGDRHVSNAGFIIDTAVRGTNLFRYRFTFLREKNQSIGGKLDMHGWSTTHDFTFALVESKTMRIWLGPQMKLSYYNKLTLNTDEEIVYASGWLVDSRLGDVWYFGVGPAIGLNANLPHGLSFCFSAAFHIISNYSGDTDYRTTNGNQYGDLNADSNGLYLTVGVIYRLNE